MKRKIITYIVITVIRLLFIIGAFLIAEEIYTTAFIEGDKTMQVYFWIILIMIVPLGLLGIVLWLNKKKVISNKFENILSTILITPFIILLVLGAIISVIAVIWLFI